MLWHELDGYFKPQSTDSRLRECCNVRHIDLCVRWFTVQVNTENSSTARWRKAEEFAIERASNLTCFPTLKHHRCWQSTSGIHEFMKSVTEFHVPLPLYVMHTPTCKSSARWSGLGCSEYTSSLPLLNITWYWELASSQSNWSVCLNCSKSNGLSNKYWAAER